MHTLEWAEEDILQIYEFTDPSIFFDIYEELTSKLGKVWKQREVESGIHTHTQGSSVVIVVPAWSGLALLVTWSLSVRHRYLKPLVLREEP